MTNKKIILLKKTILKNLLSIFLIACSAVALTAQSPKMNVGDGSSPLRVGQLENGLTYYIYRDSTFANEKVRMGFFVKAGGYHQRPEEIEYAHMIEHIPFVRDSVYPEGVHRFLKYDLVPFADVSARTGNQYTRYYFHYPQLHPEAYEAGLSWFREIAADLRFTEAIMDRVRSQVQGEIIHASRKLIQAVAGVGAINMHLYNMRKIHPRDLINYMEQYKAADLKAFYDRWYHPDRMGVFVVGHPEKSAEQIVEDIEAEFGDLKQPERSPEGIDYNGKYLSRENQYVNIDTRGLMQRPEIELYFRKKPALGISTIASLKDVLLTEMVMDLVGSHLRQLNHSLHSEDILSILGREERQPPSNIIKIELKKSQGIQAGLQLPIIEFRKIIANGLTDVECRNAISTIKENYLNREGRDLREIMDELYENFWREDGFLPDEKAQRIESILKGLSKAELEEHMQALFNPQSKLDVVIKSTDRISTNLSEQQVFDWMDEAWRIPIEEWEASFSGPEQIEIEPIRELLSQQQLSQLSRTTDYRVNEVPEYGITEMDLPNGMKIVLKPFQPTSGFKDRLHVQVIKPKGAAEFEGSDYFAALHAAEIVSVSGLGSHSKMQLDAYFRQPGQGGFYLSPYVYHTASGFRGWCVPERLEGLLEYLYLYLTKPRVEDKALQDWKAEKTNELLSNQFANDLILRDTMGHFFMGEPKVEKEDIAAIDKDRVLAMYKALIGNSKGYTIVLSGDFELAPTMKLVSKYLGAVPEGKELVNKKKEVKPTHLPQGPVQTLLAGADPRKSDVRVVYSGRLEYTPEEDAGLYVLNKVLWDRMRNRLRNEEENSTVYDAFSHYELYNQNDHYKFTIIFNCVPSKTERLMAAVRNEVQKLREDGPDPKLLKNVLSELVLYYIPAYEGKAEQVTRQLVEMYKYNKERVPLYRLKDYIQHITVSDVKELAQKYLKDENYYQFIVRSDQ